MNYKSVFSLVNSTVIVAVSAFAAGRPAMSINISYLQGAQQQTSRLDALPATQPTVSKH